MRRTRQEKAGSFHGKKKTRIAVLYNEPVMVPKRGGVHRGKRNSCRKAPLPMGVRRQTAHGKPLATQAMIDLSEIGVVEEMEDIKFRA